MTRLIVRPSAEADIQEASDWYDGRAPSLGARFLDELGSTLARLREAPLHFPSVGRGVRRALLGKFPYAVYFLAGDADRRIVIAVLHQQRHPATWRRRLREGR